ncbi:hypothetical protein [Nonomuraea sp. GTA35]|uniref:hypothetical protein n=1 Tax=Nonomuraea sp. GTA35 TaxID=1676746 RepID=UPI0035C09FCF
MTAPAPDEPPLAHDEPFLAHDEPDTQPVTLRDSLGEADEPPDRTPQSPAPAPKESPGDDDAAPVDLGTPVGQLAAGAVLVLVLGGWLLYRLGGWTLVLIVLGALVALAVLVVAAPFIWRALRRRGSGSGSRRSWPASGPRGTSAAARAPRGGGAGGGRGGLRSALGRLMPGGRPRAPGAAGGRAGGHTASKDKRGWAGRAGRAIAAAARRLTHRSGREHAGGRDRRDRAAHRGPVRRSAAAVARGARAAGRRVGSLLSPVGRAARRAGSVIGRGLRRAGRQADRVTGGRLSRVWARIASAGWPRALLTRLARWDERLTGGLVAAVWSWWRRRKASDEDAEHASDGRSEDDEATVELPNAGTTSSTAATAAATTTTGRSMSEFALVTHATELPTIAAEYESDHMMDVRGHMQMLRELPLAAGTAVRIWTERLAADYPLNADAAEALQRVYDAFGAAVEAADEALVIFEGSHEHDIELQLQPRVNEYKWNNR